MNTPAVQVQNLHKHFGSGETRVEVLRGIDFKAPAGKMTFLVGPSGCGKTTLISVIAGLLEPSQGNVAIFGTNLAKLPAKQQILFRRQNLGFVFQQYNLLPALTAADNAAIPLLAAGMPRKQALERARAVLETMGLGNRGDALPRVLSGGQLQRVAMARALVHEPKLIICDEPTAALDHKSGDAVMHSLSTAAMHGDRAVIVVTHDSRVYNYADSITHMNDGQVTHAE